MGYRDAIISGCRPFLLFASGCKRLAVLSGSRGNRNLEQTVILITHDEKAALEAERILTIEDGRIIGDERRR